MVKEPKQEGRLNARKMDPATFGGALGQAVWLMTMSAEHKEKSIKSLETNVLPAILFQQFKLYSKGSQPVAFLTWAKVSGEIKKRLEAGNKAMELTDWRSGNHVMIVDCVSPFNPKEVFEKTFLDGLKGKT